MPYLEPFIRRYGATLPRPRLMAYVEGLPAASSLATCMATCTCRLLHGAWRLMVSAMRNWLCRRHSTGPLGSTADASSSPCTSSSRSAMSLCTGLWAPTDTLTADTTTLLPAPPSFSFSSTCTTASTGFVIVSTTRASLPACRAGRVCTVMCGTWAMARTQCLSFVAAGLLPYMTRPLSHCAHRRHRRAHSCRRWGYSAPFLLAKFMRCSLACSAVYPSQSSLSLPPSSTAATKPSGTAGTLGGFGLWAASVLTNRMPPLRRCLPASPSLSSACWRSTSSTALKWSVSWLATSTASAWRSLSWHSAGSSWGRAASRPTSVLAHLHVPHTRYTRLSSPLWWLSVLRHTGHTQHCTHLFAFFWASVLCTRVTRQVGQ
eukprot:comp23763_c0_seq1/m.41150 comp23763_c0_seq1/g.41150  ORF comp23763_c0_seq1/g.41150 comp23763_c0_seq1/m.41150 type:complete len:375 (+) comp23763_c0_seq1:81-1205(+)